MRPLIVFLHGFTGRPENFDRVARRLPDGVEVLGVSLAGHMGHGVADNPPPSFEAEVERVLSECSRRSARPCHLVGYSLGGRIALGMLALDPKRFSSATLIGTHPGLATAAERAQRQATDEAWCRILETRGIEAFVDAWQAQPLFRSQLRAPPGRIREQRRQRLSHDPMGLAIALRTLGLARMPNFRPILGAIHTPITLVTGQMDTKFSALALEMVDTLPRARLVSAPSAGHNVVLERPGFLAELLRPMLMPTETSYV